MTRTPVTLLGKAAELVERIYELRRALGKETSKAKIVEEAVLAYCPKILAELEAEMKAKVKGKKTNSEEQVKQALFGNIPKEVWW